MHSDTHAVLDRVVHGSRSRRPVISARASILKKCHLCRKETTWWWMLMKIALTAVVSTCLLPCQTGMTQKSKPYEPRWCSEVSWKKIGQIEDLQTKRSAWGIVQTWARPNHRRRLSSALQSNNLWIEYQVGKAQLELQWLIALEATQCPDPNLCIVHQSKICPSCAQFLMTRESRQNKNFNL